MGPGLGPRDTASGLIGLPALCGHPGVPVPARAPSVNLGSAGFLNLFFDLKENRVFGT